MVVNRKLIEDQDTSNLHGQQLGRDAAFLRQALKRAGGERWVQKPGAALLVVLSGLPGTGKSYFAKALAQQVPFLVLESDRLRKLLVPRPQYTPGEHSRVFAVCYLLIEEYLAQGRRVLFDATNLTEAFRRPLYQICDRLTVPLALVRFTAPRGTVKRRLADRASGMHPGDNSDAGWQVYCRLLPYEEPIQREHFTVDSSGDISLALEDIARLATTEI